MFYPRTILNKIPVILLLLFSGMQINAQTADEIITRHLENSGGIAQWKSLNSIIIHGDAILGLDQAFPLVIYHKRPYQKKVVFIVQGNEVLNEGYDGSNGWTYSEISGKNEIMRNYQPDAFDTDLLEYKKKGFEAALIGKAKSENTECYKIELIKNTNKTTYCFAVNDYKLLWEENKDEKLLYYDYKKFNGLEFATRIIGQPVNGGEYVLKFNKIEINPAIADKVFKF